MRDYRWLHRQGNSNGLNMAVVRGAGRCSPMHELRQPCLCHGLVHLIVTHLRKLRLSNDDPSESCFTLRSVCILQTFQKSSLLSCRVLSGKRSPS